MGPFSGSSHALLLFLCLANSFRGGNNSFCNTKPWLAACLLGGWDQAGLVQLLGLVPPTHHHSLMVTRMGKEKRGAIPSPQISPGAIPDKQVPNPACSCPPCFCETKPAQAVPAIGMIISAGM